MWQSRQYIQKAAVIVACFGLAACNTSNETIGATAGAIAGGVVGNQFGGGRGRTLATVVGALAGGVIGGNIGRNLDERSRNAALQAEYNALENGRSGQPVNWQGSGSTYGQVVPQQAYQVGSQDCRRYTHTIYIDGQPSQASGTACRNPDGTWTPLA
ncbi:MAG: glycine zipper 2TM domain-containing protein [Rhizobiaceae bacterium]|nr:glycine zipper 2TM domain-containing protein [Rhizobiaceae bacterium]